MMETKYLCVVVIGILFASLEHYVFLALGCPDNGPVYLHPLPVYCWFNCVC